MKNLLLLAVFIGFLSCTKESDTVDPIILDKDISEDTILSNVNDDPSAIDYIVTKENLNVNAKLTIEPGVRIAFEANTSLKLPYTGTGSISAKGSAALPIIFTGTTKSAGFWKGVLIVTDDTNNTFEHCTFEYGGGATLLSNGNPNCNVLVAKQATVQGKVNFNNCTFQHSNGIGLAVTIDAKLLSFKSNAFLSNKLAPLQLPPSEVAMIDATSNFSGANGYNGVEVLSESLDELTEARWNKLSNASAYKILGNITVLSGLNIQAGVILEMSTAVLLRTTFPKGYIQAIGTAADKITIKGVNADKGSWKGILFTSSDLKNELIHCIITGAGGGSLITGLSLANVGVFTQSGNIGKLKLTNCNIENGAGCGVSIGTSTSVVQSDNTFLNLTGANICN